MDRALGKHIVSGELKEHSQKLNPKLSFKIICHDEIFDNFTKDPVWLEEAGKKGWLVFTKDKRIRHRTAEFNMVIKYNVRMFTLTSGNLTGTEMAKIILKVIPKIPNFIKKNSAPFIVSLTKSGNLKILDIK